MKKKVVNEKLIQGRIIKSQKQLVDEGNDKEGKGMKGVPSKHKKREGKSVVAKVYKTIRTRSSPHPLYDALRFLSNSQKKCLVDMGFGFLIGMNIHLIPSKLSKYIVENFKQSTMCINMKNDSIKITPKLVKEILGIPLGGENIKMQKSEISNDELIRSWRSQFKEKITPKRVADMIKKTDDDGIMFKMNFLVVFYNVMSESDESGAAKVEILKYISEGVEIRNLDWCTFVWDCLKETKKPKTYYCGSLTLLVLIYLHCTNCNEVKVLQTRPAILSWTTDLMRDREDFEIDNGGFGYLELLPRNEEFFKDHSTQKDLEIIEDKIEAELLIMTDGKNKLNEFINTSIRMFPDNPKLKELKEKFDVLFDKGVGNNLDDFSENEFNYSVFEKDFTSGNNDVAQDETLGTANYDVGEDANDTDAVNIEKETDDVNIENIEENIDNNESEYPTPEVVSTKKRYTRTSVAEERGITKDKVNKSGKKRGRKDTGKDAAASAKNADKNVDEIVSNGEDAEFTNIDETLESMRKKGKKRVNNATKETEVGEAHNAAKETVVGEDQIQSDIELTESQPLASQENQVQAAKMCKKNHGRKKKALPLRRSERITQII